MDISIIIVSYNTRELLSDCLESISRYSKNIKCETFVVDNNSSDKTAEFVSKNNLWVKLIANKQNLGFSKANNLALKKSVGKYVLIINPDTKLMPKTLSRMKDFMDNSEQDLAVATCRVELESGQMDKDCRRLFPTPIRALAHFSGLSKVFKKSAFFNGYYCGHLPEDKEHEIDACVGAFMFIKKDLLDKVGYFDEDYFFYGEDLDLCYRFKEAGYKIIYTPITKIIHYKGASSGIKSHSQHLSKASIDSKVKVIKESTRAMTLFYKKHYIDSYPKIINYTVLTAIWLISKIRLLKIQL